MTLAEQIARIINPGGWDFYDRNPSSTYDVGPAEYGLTPSLDRANQIITIVREEAAMVCEQKAQDFLSEQYATPQPLGSFSERYACGECAKGIRKLESAS